LESLFFMGAPRWYCSLQTYGVGVELLIFWLFLA